jgi:hypothetical protein
MTKTIIKVDESGAPEKFADLLAGISADGTVAGVLVLACEANSFTPSTVDDALKAISKPIFGGIFPEVIYGNRKLSKGAVVIGLPVEPQLLIVPGLSDEEQDFETLLGEWQPALNGEKTMFVWVDGLSSRISDLLESMFLVYGPAHNYIGGGAGSLSLVQQPCLFTNQGLVQDSGVLAVLDVPSSIGVSHGWTYVSGPYKVTESTRNVIKTLNWQPAFDVYRGVIDPMIEQPLSQENFFDFAKRHPLGIARLNAENIVRDPILVGDDGSLICVGEVSEESHIDILHGNPECLINAARQASMISRQSFDGVGENALTFVADCISRVLFLGDAFENELQAISGEGATVGALTLGEIANNGQDYLEFYNKTVVVGLLEI